MSPLARMALFAIVAATILTLLHLYLYLRLVRDTIANRRLRLLGKVAVVLLALALVGARFVYARLPPSWAVPYSTVTWLWMGLATYLVLTFATVGLARRLYRLASWMRSRLARPAPVSTPSAENAAAAVPSGPAVDASRRLFVSRVVAGSALAVSSGFVGMGAFRAFQPPVLTELSLKLSALPRTLDGFRIVHLSDIHVGGIIEQRFMRELVQRCNGLAADLVVITGDLVDGDVPTLGPAVAELRNLNARYGTYFCNGNHEYYSGVDEWNAALPRMQVTPLRNRFVQIGEPGASFDLIGVDDWSQRRAGGYDLEAACQGRDPARPAVLLAHQPQNFEGAMARGVGLQLSGHTHGGQLFPNTIAVDLIFRYSVGHYPVGDRHIFVSSGTGFWGPPLRVGSTAEIAQITLLS